MSTPKPLRREKKALRMRFRLWRKTVRQNRDYHARATALVEFAGLLHALGDVAP